MAKFTLFLAFAELIAIFLIVVSYNRNPQSRQYFRQLRDIAGLGGIKGTDFTSTLFLGSIGSTLFENAGYYTCRALMFNSEQGFQLTDAYISLFLDQLRQKTFEGDYFGEVKLKICPQIKYKILTIEEEAKRILSNKPASIIKNDFLNNIYKSIQGEDRKKMMIYHITDFHLNINYTEGTNSYCGDLVCGRPNSGIPDNPMHISGKWGDYHGDSNPMIIQRIALTMNQTGRPDFILWTGDNNDHLVTKDPELTVNATIYATRILNEIFPDIPIFPLFGNHEFAPTNGVNYTFSHEIDMLGDIWSDWMTPEVKANFKKTGTYAFLASEHPKANSKLKKQMKKTRIIAIDTQVCYFFNIFLIGQTDDPNHTIEWLETTLTKMEEAGEDAILIGHVPVGRPDGINAFSQRIRLLMDRFQHIIRLNLFGHTHIEDYEVIRSYESKDPIGINFVSASITPYTPFGGNNPSFRVITLDLETKVPLEIKTFMMNLTKANQNDDYAIFSFEREFTQEYGIQDLSPSEVWKLSQRFQEDEQLSLKYLRNLHSNGPGADKFKECGRNGRLRLSCDTSYSTFFESLDGYNNFEISLRTIISGATEFAIGEWVKKIK